MNAPTTRVEAGGDGSIRIQGDLVFATAGKVLADGSRLLVEAHGSVLDLDAVNDVDSAGLACVLALLAAARRHGDGTLTVRNPPRSLMALATVSDVDSLLQVTPETGDKSVV